MRFIERLGSLDRRYIFILIALTAIIPLIFPVGMQITITPEVQSVHDYIEQLPQGSVVLVALDFDPAAQAELYPMSLAILRHAYAKKHKVIGMTMWISGVTLGDKIMREASEGLAERDKDYSYLGYMVGGGLAIMRMGEDISKVFNTDYDKKPISEIPVMKGIKNYKDIALLIDIAAGATPESWIVYAGTPYKVPVAIGVTAVSAVGYYPFLSSNQIIGLIGGMKGAAEYEKLIDHRGSATGGMDSQSIAHTLIILLIIVANISYFAMRRKTKNAEN
jgi:hypothetical protein